MNNKGFTLIEVLAVIVVLVAILLVALPNIASTFERQKNKINEQRIETIISAGEIYASRYKRDLGTRYNDFLNNTCGISIQMLLNNNMVTKDELKSSNGGNLKFNNVTITEDNYSTIMVKYKNGDYYLDNNGTEC